MKQLKRLFVFALLLSVVGTFTACGNNNTTGTNDTKVEETEDAKVSPSPERNSDETEATDNGNDSGIGNDNQGDGAVGDVVEDVGDGVEQGVDGVIDGVENATDDMTDGGGNNASPTPTTGNNQ